MKAGFLEKRRMGFPTQLSFLEKTPEEFARDAGSWRKAGRNSQKSQLPGKETEGIHIRAGFLRPFAGWAGAEANPWKSPHKQRPTKSASFQTGSVWTW
jgi:hypothetical protein